MLTPAVSAILFVVRPSMPSWIRMRRVASRMAATMARPLSFAGVLLGWLSACCRVARAPAARDRTLQFSTVRDGSMIGARIGDSMSFDLRSPSRCSARSGLLVALMALMT